MADMEAAWDAKKWITPRDVERSRTSRDLDGLRHAAELLRGQGRHRFLDIGCGFGGLTRLVGDHLGASEIHGIDIDPRVEDEVRTKQVQFVRHDAAQGQFPYDDGHFDAVMTLGMMDYLEYFDGMIREMNRLLAVDGRVLVALPNLASWHNRLMLLLGYQPRDVEISAEVLAGVPRRPYLSSGERPAGHIHIPTARAFVDLMRHHGFEKVALLASRPSIHSANSRLLATVDRVAALRPTLARRFYYVGVKRYSPEPPERSPDMPYQCL
jgi:SAM-dependent methyltransferase